jgi:hypothetical protein
VREKHLQLAGINARWRFFRYAADAVYHPHIDGSWKAGGFDSEGWYQEELHHDRCSQFTFLIYLNEGFDGGGTTFYGVNAPFDDDKIVSDNSISTGKQAACSCILSKDLQYAISSVEKGIFPDAQCGECVHNIFVRAVQPKRGAVMCFPHGRAAGALVHEGSAVNGGISNNSGKEETQQTPASKHFKYVIRSDIMYYTGEKVTGFV